VTPQQLNTAMLKEIFTRTDPDQFRPHDTVSMSFVEEVIDAHLVAVKESL